MSCCLSQAGRWRSRFPITEPWFWEMAIGTGFCECPCPRHTLNHPAQPESYLGFPIGTAGVDQFKLFQGARVNGRFCRNPSFVPG